MATPRDVINEVLADLERPDFKDKAELKFYAAIKSAHLPKFVRDTKTYSTATLTKATNSLTLSLPGELRVVRAVRLYSSYTTPSGIVTPGQEIYLSKPYQSGLGKAELADYYGIKYPHTFTADGASLYLTNPDSSTTCVSIDGIFWPSFKFDSGLGDYASDSWILREFPAIIHAYLFQALSLFQGSAEVKQSAAANLQQKFQEFLVAYSHESLN